MPLPPHQKRIASKICASATKSERAKLAHYLAEIQSDDELFCRCLRKAVAALERFNDSDLKWLLKWLPIIERGLDK